ncbi:MAG: hypothetical protein FD161_1232 [Limisphaerales bacterium]|nr:MAG: hypothetical protein FD161_1232 [Limisphaerales bacterium]TXT49504.1 MAG: hypothetical protein FD140_3036 [Limisphaerales bacterium]
MKHADLKQFLALQQSLADERRRVQARLAEINRVLGGGNAAAAPSLGRRTFSAATKAKMAAAQKARWAKRGAKPDSAADKARWAKVNAQKAKSGAK